MNARQAVAWLLMTCAVAAAPGCRARQARHARLAPPPAADAVTLLPDPDTGVVGRITVANRHGSVSLASPWTTTRIAADGAPAAPGATAAAARTRIAQALAALPKPPRTFTVLFQRDTDRPTHESAALVPAILQACAERGAPEVRLVGHTDAGGTSSRNLALGWRRADAVKALLVRAGVPPASIEAVSRGEDDLLVPTPDETPEPRNRRVDVTIR